jgi:ATP-dependent Clp protease ATP-binding subunit ClpA
MKPALSRGEIQVIGATTFKEYRKHIEKDAALERRFQPVVIDEPSVDETVNVLSGLKNYYEKYHGVTVDESLIRTAVELSERYINDRFLPDKAIDLLDEAAACASLRDPVLQQYRAAVKQQADFEKQLLELKMNRLRARPPRTCHATKKPRVCNRNFYKPGRSSTD